MIETVLLSTALLVIWWAAWRSHKRLKHEAWLARCRENDRASEKRRALQKAADAGVKEAREEYAKRLRERAERRKERAQIVKEAHERRKKLEAEGFQPRYRWTRASLPIRSSLQKRSRWASSGRRAEVWRETVDKQREVHFSMLSNMRRHALELEAYNALYP